MSGCIFCRIAAGEVPSRKVFEDGVDAWPKFQGAKEEIENVFQRVAM